MRFEATSAGSLRLFLLPIWLRGVRVLYFVGECRGVSQGQTGGAKGHPKTPWRGPGAERSARAWQARSNRDFPFFFTPAPSVLPLPSYGQQKAFHEDGTKLCITMLQMQNLVGWYYYSTITAEYIKSDDSSPCQDFTGRPSWGVSPAAALTTVISKAFIRLS